MTAYLTSTELGQLSALPSEILSGLDAPTLAAAIAAGCKDADGYLAARFTLPLTAWGDELKQHVADLVGYRLASRHGYSTRGTGENSDIRLRFEDAVIWFRAVSQGKIHPNVVDTRPVAEAAYAVYSNVPRGW